MYKNPPLAKYLVSGEVDFGSFYEESTPVARWHDQKTGVVLLLERAIESGRCTVESEVFLCRDGEWLDVGGVVDKPSPIPELFEESLKDGPQLEILGTPEIFDAGSSGRVVFLMGINNFGATEARFRWGDSASIEAINGTLGFFVVGVPTTLGDELFVELVNTEADVSRALKVPGI